MRTTYRKPRHGGEARYGKVIADQSISLDGFTTGPNVSVANPLGDDGERLHQWMSSNPTNVTVSGEPFQMAGAFIVGRRVFDVGVGPWGDEPPFRAPVFVVTHRAREPLPKAGGTTYCFSTGGVAGALSEAKSRSGTEGCDRIRRLAHHRPASGDPIGG